VPLTGKRLKMGEYWAVEKAFRFSSSCVSFP